MLGAAALAVAVAVLTVGCSSALAARAHPFLSSLALPGFGPEPVAVAVDSGSGDVFVADDAIASSAVDVFGPTGEYLTQFGRGTFEQLNNATQIGGLAVDASGRVYVAASAPGGELETGGLTHPEVRGVVYVFTPDGLGGYRLLSEWRGQGTPFGFISGLAVDNSTSPSDPAAGDVYVQDGSAGLIDVLKPPPAAEEAKEGLLVATLHGKPKFETLGKTNALAVSATTGRLYAANYLTHLLIEVFSAAGVLEPAITGAASPTKQFGAEYLGLAVEDPGETLYVGAEGFVDEFSAGVLLGSTSTAATTAPIVPVAVAVDNSAGATRGNVYVVDRAAHAVDAYGAGVPAPTVTTGKATSVAPTPGTGVITAVLNGTIDPEGEASTYRFEYRKENTAPFTSTPPEEASGSGPLSVQATIDVAPEKVYEFRLVGESDAHKGATTYGLLTTFSKQTPYAVSGVNVGVSKNIASDGATLTGTLDPKGDETEYRFEYGETIGYGKATAPVTTSSTQPVLAEAAISALTPGRTYHFRIAATNKIGTTYGGDATFATTPAGAPAVASESAEPTPEPAPAGTETLKALIAANGQTSRYRFELGESEAYGLSTPETEVPANGSAEAVFSGLKAETTYHFRVVASNATGESRGADATFTTSAAPAAPASTLPDGRRYELVSPPEKRGAYIQALLDAGGVIQASADGNALTYVVIGPLVGDPEGNDSPHAQQVLAVRNGSVSWTSQELVAPSERVRTGEENGLTDYTAFSEDLSLALTRPVPISATPLAEPPLTPPLSEAERGHQEKTIYLRADAPLAPGASEAAIYEQARRNGEALAGERGASAALPGYLALVNAKNTPPGTAYGGTQFVGRKVNPALSIRAGTPDMTHVVLGSQVALTAPPSPSAPGLYEWAAGGSLQLVSVLPSGQPAAITQDAELGSGSTQGLENNTSEPDNYRHAISEDGSRVIWSTGRAGLFLRDTVRGETVQLDAPVPGINPTPGRVAFQNASADGSKVFFTDTEPLTADAKARLGDVANGKIDPDLYECEIVERAGKLACALSDLTAPGSTAETASVKAVVAASEDGSYVYVLAMGVLATGAQPGAHNLYVLHQEGGVWSTRFIATLSPEDFPDWGANDFNPDLMNPVTQTTRVSPNGRYLAFMSDRRLTGYDNTDVNEETGRHADEEVFLYDAGTARVSCPSCNPMGARPRGVLDTKNAGEGVGLLVDQVKTWASEGQGPFETRNPDSWLAGSIPGGTPASRYISLHQPRYLSDSGRLFFMSADALVPEVVARTRPETIVPGHEPANVGVENVYQYEPAGVGDCASGAGCVALISSGASERESALLDASPTGDDVFFMTDSKLLTQDTDASYDIYDARVCGSAPCQPPPPPPAKPCASSEQCRPVLAMPETLVTPLTPSFSGPGNTTHLVASAGELGQTVSHPTRAQRLARALKACRKLARRTRAQRHERAVCEARARAHYGPRHKLGGTSK